MYKTFWLYSEQLVSSGSMLFTARCKYYILPKYYSKATIFSGLSWMCCINVCLFLNVSIKVFKFSLVTLVDFLHIIYLIVLFNDFSFLYWYLDFPLYFFFQFYTKHAPTFLAYNKWLLTHYTHQRMTSVIKRFLRLSIINQVCSFLVILKNCFWVSSFLFLDA